LVGDSGGSDMKRFYGVAAAVIAAGLLLAGHMTAD
jgi:hypothetical protein